MNISSDFWRNLTFEQKREQLIRLASSSELDKINRTQKYHIEDLRQEVLDIINDLTKNDDPFLEIEGAKKALRSFLAAARKHFESENKKIACIYKITHPKFGCYVGRTKDLVFRLCQHVNFTFTDWKYKYNFPSEAPHITNHNVRSIILKKGWYKTSTGLIVEILEFCSQTDINYMRQREQYWIDRINPRLNKYRSLGKF